MAMRRKLRNAKGRAKGYGGCYRCGDTWDWACSHDTPYGQEGWATAACFPLCEDCWQKLGTPEARWPYYDALIKHWESESGERADLYHLALTGEKVHEERRRLIHRAVFAGL